MGAYFSSCRNCGSADDRYIVPRELVEQQIGWKLDIPAGSKVAEKHRQEDLEYDMVRLCKDCLLGILRVEAATDSLLHSKETTQ